MCVSIFYLSLSIISHSARRASWNNVCYGIILYSEKFEFKFFDKFVLWIIHASK